MIQDAASIRDATTEYQAEEETRRSLHWFRPLFESSPAGIFLADSENRIIEANPMAEALLGYERGELLGKAADEIVPPEEFEPEAMRAATYEMSNVGGASQAEARFLKNDGSLIDVSITARAVELPGYGAVQMVEFHDVTRRKAAERKVAALLEEKDLLIREAHHRIKNDMNFVRSLLSLQANTTPDRALATSLNEASNRILVMGHVYDRLHKEGTLHTVDAGRLVETLVRDLQNGFLPLGMRVDVHADPCEVSTRLSVSVGIILNELITNAAKYAFSTVTEPTITVTLRREQETVQLTVRDNGSGFPDSVISGAEGGYGTTIMNALVEQHGGALELWNDEGGVVRVRLPLP